MRGYLIYVKNIRSRIILLFILILLSTVILQSLNKDIPPELYFSGITLVVFIIGQVRVSYYYIDKSSRNSLNQVQTSFLPLLFCLPIKRSTIVIRDFTIELIITIAYIAGLSIPYLIFDFLTEGKFIVLDILKIFLFSTSLTIGSLFLYSTLLALLSAIPIKNLFSIAAAIVNFCFFSMFYAILALISNQNPILAQIISALYNDSKNFLFMMLISAVLYLTAVGVNIKMIYRWEV